VGTRKDLAIFESSQPSHERYQFLNSVLDVGEYYCKMRELYTVSGTISPIAHTTPRRLMAVFNQPEFQRRLRGYELEDMTAVILLAFYNTQVSHLWRIPQATCSDYYLYLVARLGKIARAKQPGYNPEADKNPAKKPNPAYILQVPNLFFFRPLRSP
jgi:hypothetical protein